LAFFSLVILQLLTSNWRKRIVSSDQPFQTRPIKD
jgi:hypothetical protein